MFNFEFKNPTKIIFGKGEIYKVAKEIPAGSKVLMVYGGGSIKKNGVYQQVKEALSSFDVVEFGGVPANPEYSILLQALEIIKKENILFDVEAKDKDDMIKQMVESFDKQGYLSDKEQFYKDVLAREEVFSSNTDTVKKSPTP